MQSSNIIEVFEKAGFGKIKNPKIRFEDNIITIKQYPAILDIIVFFMMICALLYTIYTSNDYQTPLAIIICCGLVLLFGWRVFSLRRVRIDVVEKIIYRSNLNPFMILIERFLQHPVQLSFKQIKIYIVIATIHGIGIAGDIGTHLIIMSYWKQMIHIN